MSQTETRADLLPTDKPRTHRRIVNLLGPMLGLILIIFAGGVVEYIKEGTVNYWTVNNQCTILTQTVVVALGAIGMTMVIIMAGIDLSAGSVIALAAVSTAWIAREFSPEGLTELGGVPGLWIPLVAILVGVFAGSMAGATNGFLITRLKLAPFIITLGMMSMARGLAKGFANMQRVDAPRNWIGGFSTENLLRLLADALHWRFLDWLANHVSITAAVLVTIALAIGGAVLLGRTRFGRHIFAVGSNEATARLCGVRVERVKWIVYTLAGAMFGLAGVVNYGRLAVGDPTTAMAKELECIAAVIIGGGSFAGGSGSIFGSLIGALLMRHLHNLCVHLGLPNYVQEIVVGAVIIVAVTVDRLRRGRGQ